VREWAEDFTSSKGENLLQHFRTLSETFLDLLPLTIKQTQPIRRREMRKNWLGNIILVLTTVILINSPALTAVCFGQERNLECKDGWFGGDKLVSFCEIKEQTIPATGGVISVDGRKNGGISIKGWNRNEILVRAKINSAAKTEAEAKEIASQIKIMTSGGQVFSEGPQTREGKHWSVSFEVFVPTQADLLLQTHNGGISISDVRGRMEFEALNGGVSLKRLAGSVKGQTTNGGLSIELSGDRWDGEILDVRTTNGGINLSLPENYNARLETGTTNGGLRVSFPITVQGRINKEISVDLGSGGPTVRAITTNGGVNINRKSIE
jgi:hypothetical protein